ncbi:MAG: hexitol phosphatase HxpB [Coriobacteriia bacterium]|nr:hexitol phosphatase HxpB [Coriobacteriia bacterium]
MIKAAIFDMDGLLIDTEKYWWQAEVEVFNSVGIPLTLDLAKTTMGMMMRDITAHWARVYPHIEYDREDVIDRVYDKLVEYVGLYGEAMSGALAAVSICEQAGLMLAIASSSYPVLIEAVMEKLNLSGRINVYASAMHEMHGKPSPDVYLSAAKKLGVDALDCLAFEDSIAGVQSAKAAGMKCIAVPDPSMFDRPEYGIADLKLHSLVQFDESMLLKLG